MFSINTSSHAMRLYRLEAIKYDGDNYVCHKTLLDAMSHSWVFNNRILSNEFPVPDMDFMIQHAFSKPRSRFWFTQKADIFNYARTTKLIAAKLAHREACDTEAYYCHCFHENHCASDYKMLQIDIDQEWVHLAEDGRQGVIDVNLHKYAQVIGDVKVSQYNDVEDGDPDVLKAGIRKVRTPDGPILMTIKNPKYVIEIEGNVLMSRNYNALRNVIKCYKEMGGVL